MAGAAPVAFSRVIVERSPVMMKWSVCALLAAALVAHATEMVDGEIRKIDKAQAKITLKHGPIKAVDMPPMTMVFRVKDAKQLDKLAAGDKVRFAVEQAGDQLVVTQIVPAP
jgi:Cu/Ag efflux protein CusF